MSWSQSLPQSTQNKPIEHAQNLEDIYPLSPIQQGMLFHSLQARQAYFVQVRQAFSEGLQVVAFKNAWQQVVQRHPVLRTLFIWEGRDKPLQVVLRRVELPWTELDWRNLSEDEQQERLHAYLIEDQQRGFELSRAPLMRFTLIQLGENSYHFVWSYHHLLSDGWSTPLVLQESMTIYQALCRGEQYSLTPARPYRDFIVWLQKQDASCAETFWRQYLAGFPKPIVLGVDRASGCPSSSIRNYAEQHLRLSTEMTRAVDTLARQNQLTLNTLVQGAWAWLLSRYSGEEDIVFGIAVAGRPTDLDGVENIIGPFINALPLRTHIKPQDTCLSWLKGLQRKQIEARQFEYSPLVDIQGWSEVPRGMPLFESVLAFQSNLTPQSVGLQDCDLHIVGRFDPERTNYPLTVVVYPDTELTFSITYDRDRFDDAAVKQMLEHLSRALEAFTATPAQSLTNISILTDAEYEQILNVWNNTTIDYPNSLAVHQMFEAQVIHTPGAVAVISEEQQLTYEELNQKANQLAHYLRQQGVGPETLVGLCVERSLDSIVGLLGILKAGGAYLPLESTYPTERLRSILTDAGVKLLLTQQQLLKNIPEETAKVICLDTKTEIFTDEPTTNPETHVMPTSLAYVIYTSGSTGGPKGVSIGHTQLVNYITSIHDRLELPNVASFALASTFAADLGNTSIFSALCYGGTLHIISQTTASEYEALASYIERHAIDCLKIVPSHLAALLTGEKPRRILPKQRLILGGEPLQVELLNMLLDLAPQCQIYNHYGPTETTVGVLTYACTSVPQETRGTVPIGKPIGNTQVYVLDAHLHPVPLGVCGEVYLGGAGLARGYLHRPELTAEKFIPNPFSSQPGTHLYRTGDKARYLSDGNLQFLGRIDHQIKLRGFRIELGEIEEVLRQHPAVREVIAHVRGDVPGEKSLVAYIVAHKGQKINIDELRRVAKDHLPEYMVPSALVLLDAFPLTSNGKVDRSALPPPIPETKKIDIRFRTYLEADLATIWTSVLKLDHLGIHDNFFELGGHSLKALELLSRIKDVTGVRVTLASLFEAPTVAGMAALMSEKSRRPPQQMIRVQKGKAQHPPVFLLPPIDGYAMDMWYLGTSLGAAHPVYALQGPGLDHETDFIKSIEELATYFIEQIRQLQPHGPYLLVGKSSGGVIAHEMTHQLEQLGEPVKLGMLDSSQPSYFVRWMKPHLWGRKESVDFLVGVWFEDVADTVRSLSTDETLSFYYQLAQQAGIIPSIWTLGDLVHWVDYAVVHGHALAAYSDHMPIIQSPIYMFEAMDETHDDDGINLDEWAEYTKGSLCKIPVPGSHSTMNDPPLVSELGKAIVKAFELAG